MLRIYCCTANNLTLVHHLSRADTEKNPTPGGKYIIFIQLTDISCSYSNFRMKTTISTITRVAACRTRRVYCLQLTNTILLKATLILLYFMSNVWRRCSVYVLGAQRLIDSHPVSRNVNSTWSIACVWSYCSF